LGFGLGLGLEGIWIDVGVILLDTSNSTTELRWRTHSNMDEDEIGWLEETYRGPEGIENRRAYVVCNVEHPNVDNWLRTPRIDRNGANRMHVEVSFTMRDCTEFPGNARSCKETFRLYAAQVDASGDAPAVWDESHWDLIDRITADTGRHSLHESSSASVNVETRSYTVTKDGVYFSFRDSGACISILNVMCIWSGIWDYEGWYEDGWIDRCGDRGGHWIKSRGREDGAGGAGDEGRAFN
uniref:Eph LBD domain-containing protein n=1 Tax=Anisakis simplex TaxID=6269 RepID=A0A0M3KDU5_ANISI